MERRPPKSFELRPGSKLNGMVADQQARHTPPCERIESAEGLVHQHDPARLTRVRAIARFFIRRERSFGRAAPGRRRIMRAGQLIELVTRTRNCFLRIGLRGDTQGIRKSGCSEALSR
jgi:hypothetical protein